MEILGAGLGIVGSLIGGNDAGDSQERAADKSAETARLGFDYLKGSPLGTQYLPAGGAANNAIAQLLGVGGPGGNGGGNGGGGQAPDEAATLAQIKQGLNAWSQSVGETENTQPILRLIDGGAPLSAVQSALQSLRTHTTHPRNTAFLDPLIKQANNPVMAQANNPVMAQGTSAGGGGDGPKSAFDNYLKSTGYQFQLGEGQRAITTSNAAKGVLNSGATAKALTKYGQNIASTSFNNYLSQLGSLSQQGLSAGASIGGAGSQAGAQGANAIAQGYGAAADSRSSGIAGAAGAAGNLFQTLSKAA